MTYNKFLHYPCYPCRTQSHILTPQMRVAAEKSTHNFVTHSVTYSDTTDMRGTIHNCMHYPVMPMPNSVTHSRTADAYGNDHHQHRQSVKSPRVSYSPTHSHVHELWEVWDDIITMLAWREVSIKCSHWAVFPCFSLRSHSSWPR